MTDYSDAWPPPVQRRYHMSPRSPVVFWLLLAATISVDAVVFSWVASEPFPAPLYAKLAFNALIVSQLSVVCIWSAVNSNKILLVPALVAAVAAAFFSAVFSDDPVNFLDEFKLNLSVCGLQAALLLAALWFFRGTNYWRRRTGVAHDLQYSLAQLLIAMTVAAVLAVTMRDSPFYGDAKWLNLGLSCSVVAFSVWSLFVWSLSRHWLLRLAAVLAFAVLLGVAFWLTADYDARISTAMGAHYLIQAIVLSAWLGWGGILPVRVTFANVDG